MDWMSILVELTFCYNGLGYNPYYAYTNELQLKITFLAKDQILMGQLFFSNNYIMEIGGINPT